MYRFTEKHIQTRSKFSGDANTSIYLFCNIRNIFFPVEIHVVIEWFSKASEDYKVGFTIEPVD